MWGAEHLGWFVLAGWLLNLTPGPDMLYIISHALRSGVRAGVVAALGIGAGCFVHIFAAALGLGALLAASATAFNVLKWAGAAYLLYVGVRLLWPRGNATPSPMLATIKKEANNSIDSSGEALKNVFFTGFLTNALNPKVALFFLAFVPQFISPAAEHKTLTFIFLGVLFNVNALPVNMGAAALAAWAAQRMQAVQRAMQWLDRVAGVMFIGFGLKLALSESPTAAR